MADHVEPQDLAAKKAADAERTRQRQALELQRERILSERTSSPHRREALSQAHPDRAMARGLPAEYIEVANAKSAAINAAYDTISRERRGFVDAL